MKTILFDLDGTLTDSGEGIMNCAEVTLAYFGLPIPDRAELRTMVGPPLADSFLRFGIPAERMDEAIEEYRKHYVRSGQFENFPYPGVRELLEKLTAKGYALYVATSKPEAMSIGILEHFDLAKYFRRICGASTDKTRNSKEAVIAYLLAECTTEGSVMMVGDTAFDVIGAKAHGIPTVGVSWGYGEIADMEAAGAIGIAYTMDELYEQLTK